MADQTLPEGTDSIIGGASGTDAIGSGASAGSGGTASAVKSAIGDIGEKTAGLRGQAADKARDYATLGKDKTVSGLDSVTRLIDDAAGTIDDKVGAQYGDYARKASEAVASLATTLRSKDIDELVTDAKAAVRNSPAIAIGAAAAIGFVVARLVKAGSAPDAEDKSASPAGKTGDKAA